MSDNNNSISQLNCLSQKHRWKVSYSFEKVSAPQQDNHPIFSCSVSIDGQLAGHAQAGSKNECKKLAAELALIHMQSPSTPDKKSDEEVSRDSPIELISPQQNESKTVASTRLRAKIFNFTSTDDNLITSLTILAENAKPAATLMRRQIAESKSLLSQLNDFYVSLNFVPVATWTEKSGEFIYCLKLLFDGQLVSAQIGFSNISVQDAERNAVINLLSSISLPHLNQRDFHQTLYLQLPKETLV